MANIKLKDKNGTDVIYNNISTLTVPTDEDLTATFYETAPSNLQEKSVFDFLCVYTYICSYAAFVL